MAQIIGKHQSGETAAGAEIAYAPFLRHFVLDMRARDSGRLGWTLRGGADKRSKGKAGAPEAEEEEEWEDVVSDDGFAEAAAAPEKKEQAKVRFGRLSFFI